MFTLFSHLIPGVCIPVGILHSHFSCPTWWIDQHLCWYQSCVLHHGFTNIMSSHVSPCFLLLTDTCQKTCNIRSRNDLLTCWSAGLTPDHQLPQCLMLVSVLGQLASQPEEVLQLWYTGSHFSEDTPRSGRVLLLLSSAELVLTFGALMQGQAVPITTGCQAGNQL